MNSILCRGFNYCYNDTLCYCLTRYPLPKFELKGKILLGGQGGKTKLLSCPVEEKKMNVKVSVPPEITFISI